MKYIIDIPSELRIKDDGYSFSDGKSYCITGNLSKLTPYVEPDRKAIEDEVWEFVNFLENKLMASDYDDIFDDNSPYDHMTYQEAKAKYEAWEAWLKQKEETRVGDEFLHTTGDGVKGVVIKIHDDDCFDILDSDGDVYEYTSMKYWEKTGRHFDEVEELLKKMRGNEEDNK